MCSLSTHCIWGKLPGEQSAQRHGLHMSHSSHAVFSLTAYTHIHTHTHIRIHIHTHTLYIYIYSIYTHTHTDINTQTHTHTHTHTHTPLSILETVVQWLAVGPSSIG